MEETSNPKSMPPIVPKAASTEDCQHRGLGAKPMLLTVDVPDSIHGGRTLCILDVFRRTLEGASHFRSQSLAIVLYVLSHVPPAQIISLSPSSLCLLAALGWGMGKPPNED